MFFLAVLDCFTKTLWTPAYVAYAAAVNPNGISILLANGLFKILINGKPTFTNGKKSLQRNAIVCISL